MVAAPLSLETSIYFFKIFGLDSTINLAIPGRSHPSSGNDWDNAIASPPRHAGRQAEDCRNGVSLFAQHKSTWV